MRDFTLSVSQLNEYVRKTLASDPMLHGLRIAGEISNFKRHGSGHWYFTLKDEDAAIGCVMFRQAAQTVRFCPADGMRVTLAGSVGLYAKTGAYQFYAEGMEQDGLGELYLRFAMLKERLAREGLFDPSLKQPLPLLPAGLGIITSKTGAVIHDIARVAWRRHPGMPLYLCPVKVQGEGAAREIADALALMDRFARADVLIVGRGGGSMEDLWTFNEERVARAIAACHKPVVSAVGHETDFTIADFAADVRAATPSAAAELCVPALDALRAKALAPLTRMRHALERGLTRRELAVNRLYQRMERRTPEKRVQALEAALQAQTLRMGRAAERAWLGKSNRLRQATLRLRATGPMETMRRGYAIALKNGQPVRSVSQAAIGDALDIRLRDGRLRAVVQNVEREE